LHSFHFSMGAGASSKLAKEAREADCDDCVLKPRGASADQTPPQSLFHEN
jgi:hypothetical protein